MARSVKVGDFQALQRQQRSAPSSANGGGEDAVAESKLTVPEQLAALEIHATAGSAFADVVKRLKTRCSLLDIPALDEEIAAEARRRCNMLPEPAAVEDAEVGEEQVAQIFAEKHARGLHAGLVVGGCPSCEDAETGPTVEDAIAAADGLPLYADAPDEVIASLGQDDPAGDPPFQPRAEDQTDAFVEPMEDRLADLDVGAQCTAEMSLSMIVGRVKDAAFDAHLDSTDAEVVAEAERIWEGFDVNPKGPRAPDWRRPDYIATTDSDGVVADVRPAEMTPDRGPDVGTKVHKVGDEQRFSGAGDGQARQVSKLIPADKDFSGKAFREASELVSLADELIGEHGYFEHLENCTIRYFWRRKTGVSKGQRITGGLDRGSGLKGFLLGTDFAIWLAADTARERQFDDRRVRRHLFRQLRRIGQDDKGNWIELPYTLQIFTEEITEFADVGDDDLRIGRGAFRNADQMGLFSDDDEAETVEDDGAGVLIHDDGTPMTQAEIEEMELAEEHGEEEDDDEDAVKGEDEADEDLETRLDAALGDDPSDPDGPAPDEDDLADLPFA